MSGSKQIPSLREDVLWILTAQQNNTRISAKRGEELTGAIIQEVRCHLRHAFRHGAPTVDDLIETLGVD